MIKTSAKPTYHCLELWTFFFQPDVVHCHKTDTIVKYLVRMCLVLMRAWLLEWTPRRCLVDSTRKRCEVVKKWIETWIQQKRNKKETKKSLFFRLLNQISLQLFEKKISTHEICVTSTNQNAVFEAFVLRVQEQSMRRCVSCFWCTFLAKHSTSIMRSKVIAKRIRHQFGENYGVMCGRRFTRLWDEDTRLEMKSSGFWSGDYWKMLNCIKIWYTPSDFQAHTHAQEMYVAEVQKWSVGTTDCEK